MQIIDINGITRDCSTASPDNDFPGYMKVEYISKNRKGYTHTEWYPIIDFVKNNPKLLNLTEGAKKQSNEDLGVVTKGGSNYIEDTTKNWPINIYQGISLWVSRGKGEGELRQVVKNDRNKLYVDKPWDVVPDSSSQYVLSFNVNKHIKPANNTLPGIETKEVLEKIINKAKKTAVN